MYNNFKDMLGIGYIKKAKEVEFKNGTLVPTLDHNTGIVKFYDKDCKTKLLAISNTKLDEMLSMLNNKTTKFYIDILHHNDLDGVSSSSIITNSIFEFVVTGRANVININHIQYNYKTSVEELMMNESYIEDNTVKKILFVTDISLKDSDIEYLYEDKYYDKIIWIDHHTSSLDYLNIFLKKYNINRNSKFNNKFDIFLDTRYSAAYLCYYLFLDIDKSIPDAVEYIDSYDMKKDSEDNIESYTNGLYLNTVFQENKNIFKDSTKFDRLLFKLSSLDSVLEMGKKYWKLELEKIKVFQEFSFLYDYELNNEYKFLAYECNSGNSWKFYGKKYDIACVIKEIKNNEYQFSLYSDDEKIKEINLGKIMKNEFNGGGHPGAAGGKYVYNDKIKNRWFVNHGINISCMYYNYKIDNVLTEIVRVLNKYIK